MAQIKDHPPIHAICHKLYTDNISEYFFTQKTSKLDRVGPVDNRPSPAKLHHFCQQKRRRKKSAM